MDKWSDYLEKNASMWSWFGGKKDKPNKESYSDDDLNNDLEKWISTMSEDELKHHYMVLDIMGMPHTKECIQMSVMGSPAFQEYTLMRALNRQ